VPGGLPKTRCSGVARSSSPPASRKFVVLPFSWPTRFRKITQLRSQHAAARKMTSARAAGSSYFLACTRHCNHASPSCYLSTSDCHQRFLTLSSHTTLPRTCRQRTSKRVSKIENFSKVYFLPFIRSKLSKES
jgi:hypothetical protein